MQLAPAYPWGSLSCWQPLWTLRPPSQIHENHEQTVGKGSSKLHSWWQLKPQAEQSQWYLRPCRCYSPSKIVARLFLIHHSPLLPDEKWHNSRSKSLVHAERRGIWWQMHYFDVGMKVAHEQGLEHCSTAKEFWMGHPSAGNISLPPG